jgi:hypothetical protein
LVEEIAKTTEVKCLSCGERAEYIRRLGYRGVLEHLADASELLAVQVYKALQERDASTLETEI